MFICIRPFHNSAYMNASLMGKCAVTDIRLMFIMGKICQFIYKSGCLPEFLHLFRTYAVNPHLEFEVRDDGTKVCIPAPLPEAVYSPLYMRNALFNSNDRICN